MLTDPDARPVTIAPDFSNLVIVIVRTGDEWSTTGELVDIGKAVSTDHRNTAETVWWCAAGAAAAVGVAVVVGGAGGDLAWLGRGSVVPGDRDRVGPLTLDGQPRRHG
jgi:hypothetical protein